jgi:hypothetical protein
MSNKENWKWNIFDLNVKGGAEENDEPTWK